MTINEILTEPISSDTLDNTETFILQAWLQEGHEYLAWCEEHDHHEHVDAVLEAVEAISDEISDR